MCPYRGGNGGEKGAAGGPWLQENPGRRAGSVGGLPARSECSWALQRQGRTGTWKGAGEEQQRAWVGSADADPQWSSAAVPEGEA